MSLWINNKILPDAFCAQFTDGWWFSILLHFKNIFLTEDKYIYSLNENSQRRGDIYAALQQEGRLSHTAETKECSHPVLFTHFVVGFSWFCRFSGLLHGSSKNNTGSAPAPGTPLQEISLPDAIVLDHIAKPSFNTENKQYSTYSHVGSQE